MLAMSRKKFSWLAAGAIIALTLVPLGAGAQVKGLDILVPANPGGGWDQTARAMETALQANDLASGIQVTNVGGAGGLGRLVVGHGSRTPSGRCQWSADSRQLAVVGRL